MQQRTPDQSCPLKLTRAILHSCHTPKNHYHSSSISLLNSGLLINLKSFTLNRAGKPKEIKVKNAPISILKLLTKKACEQINFSKLIACTLLLSGSFFSFAVAAKQNNDTKKYEINWLLAHEPASVFIRAANTFAADVKKASDNKIQVNILTLKDYAKEDLSIEQVIKDVQRGKIQMSQIYTSFLGRLNSKLQILDLPFLFRDHSHAAKVLDGPIGTDLLSGLASNNLRGLSFTYSGGFRVLPTTGKQIRRIEDFSGLRIRTSGSPVAQKLFRELGAVPVPSNLKEGFDQVAKGKLDGAETTYARYDEFQRSVAGTLNETEHSLFLTALVINRSFFEGLPKRFQAIIRSAALRAAKIERSTAIEDGLNVRNSLQKKGVKIVKMPPSEQKRFRNKVQSVYNAIGAEQGFETIKKIQNY